MAGLQALNSSPSWPPLAPHQRSAWALPPPHAPGSQSIEIHKWEEQLAEPHPCGSSIQLAPQLAILPPAHRWLCRSLASPPYCGRISGEASHPCGSATVNRCRSQPRPCSLRLIHKQCARPGLRTGGVTQPRASPRHIHHAPSGAN